MLVAPLFILLFAGWMLWGWTVGESKNIKWLRIWCAPTFVITAVLIAAGAGAGISRAITLKQVEQDVARLLDNIELRVRTGGSQRVLEEIQATDQGDDPDAEAFDLLGHLSVMNENLSPKTEEIAQKPRAAELY